MHSYGVLYDTNGCLLFTLMHNLSVDLSYFLSTFGHRLTRRAIIASSSATLGDG